MRQDRPSRYARSPEAQAWQHLYRGKAWQSLRQAQLWREPLCIMCKADGRINSATICDHIIPHRGDLDLFFDPANLQSCCRLHHDASKQREEHAGHSTAVGPDGWPTDPRHPVNARSKG